MPELLKLPECGSGATPPIEVGRLQDHGWGDHERALQAPASLLSWLIRNLRCPSSMREDDLRAERRALLQGDSDQIAEGLRLLEMGPFNRGWHVLEGPSYPDVYLATSDAVIVIEGKRTEPGPTIHTTWMPSRLQMLRHLDAALEVTGPRSLWGFFMVEGSPDGLVPQVWLEACADTLRPELAAQSLPHRSEEERGIISQAFLGVTTWQRACVELGVAFEELPDEVAG